MIGGDCIAIAAHGVAHVVRLVGMAGIAHTSIGSAEEDRWRDVERDLEVEGTLQVVVDAVLVAVHCEVNSQAVCL